MAEFVSAAGKSRTASRPVPPVRAPASAAQLRVRQLMEARPEATRDAERQRLLATSPRMQELGARGDRLNAGRANRTGLPDALKADIETRSGHGLDDVRVHYNSAAPARLAALAYTRGSEIHVGPGQESQLPHEAWHVVQQKQGRVRATRSVNGLPVNDDARLEDEADSYAAGPVAAKPGDAEESDVVQRFDVAAYIKAYGIPALVALVGIGLATYYLKGWFAEAPEKAQDKAMLEQERDNSTDPVLIKILNEVLAAHADPAVGVTYGHSSQKSHAGRRGDTRDDAHDVVIDQKQITDPTQRESYVVHELTHVTSDRKYGINAEPDIVAHNMKSLALGVTDTAFRKTVLAGIETQVDLDQGIFGNKLYEHLKTRLARASVVGQEFDTVLSELFYYLSKVGTVPQKATQSFADIRKAADAAYEARNNDTLFEDEWNAL
jgi:hypothetical protein